VHQDAEPSGCKQIHQVVEDGSEIVVEKGAKLGTGPSDTGSGFVL
jgi:hypothetical protein